MEVKKYDEKPRSIDIKRAMIKARYDEMWKAGFRKDLIYEAISKEFYLTVTSTKTIVCGILTGRIKIPENIIEQLQNQSNV